jgi:hypothetical protein
MGVPWGVKEKGRRQQLLGSPTEMFDGGNEAQPSANLADYVTISPHFVASIGKNEERL